MKAVRLLALCLLFSFVSVAFAGDGSWITDYKRAQDEAKSGNKFMLVDFTGSDWCGWCIKLNREVFSKPEFKEYASKNFVLMEVDFPQGKTQSAEVKAQNEKLMEQFRVEGFPTILVLDAAGKKVGELGYMKGGPTAFIAELEKIRKG